MGRGDDSTRSAWARAARDAAGILAAVAVAAVALSAAGVGCPVRFLTGVSCPGCGMTRAWLEALRLDLPAAVAYHPLFWLFPLAVVAAVAPVRGARARRVRTALVALAACALVALWAVRLADPCDLMLLGDLAGPGDVVGFGRPGWLGLLGL